MYIYNGGRRNLKYFYSQTMAAFVVVVFHFALCLLEQGLCYLITFLVSRLNKVFGFLDHISWINVKLAVSLEEFCKNYSVDKCLSLFHDIMLVE